jgi:hypothetical protein
MKKKLGDNIKHDMNGSEIDCNDGGWMELADILLSFFVIKACNVSLFYQVKTAGL